MKYLFSLFILGFTLNAQGGFRDDEMNIYNIEKVKAAVVKQHVVYGDFEVEVVIQNKKYLVRAQDGSGCIFSAELTGSSYYDAVDFKLLGCSTY